MGAVTEICCGEETQRNPNQMKEMLRHQQKSHFLPKKMEKKMEQLEELYSTNASNFSPKSQTTNSSLQTLLGEKNYDPSDFFSRKVNLKDFEIIGKLGSGTFGTVYLTQLKNGFKNGRIEKFAMKVINVQEFSCKRMEDSLKFEKFVMQTMDHPFLTRLRFAFKDATNVYLVMECGIGGPVDSFLAFKASHNKKNPRTIRFRQLGESGVRFLAANVVLGIEELHRNNIMYRDLKPENVIIFEDGYAKLTDFGLSKLLSPTEATNTQAGTLYYFAPEVVTNSYYTKAIDFWALGVFLFELATSKSPFSENQILLKNSFSETVKKSQKQRDWKRNDLSSDLKDLINLLLKCSPQERLGVRGFQEIKRHPFFSQIDWEKLLAKELESPLLPILKDYPIKISEVTPHINPLSLNSVIDDNEDDWDYNSYKSCGK